MPKADYFRTVAQHIDREIHRNYHLYAGNYVAADMLTGDTAHADRYTAEQREQFLGYVAKKMEMINLPNPDQDYLRKCILTMYANPVFNYEAAWKD
jgi:hypothetical protein